VNGFSLHANTDIPAHRRDQLERLMRYTARSAVSLERLTDDDHRDLVRICSPGHGPTAPPVSSCHRWSFEKSWPRSCPCRVSTSCATAAVERRIARFEPRSFLHHASRVWTGRRLKLAPPTGIGAGCWAAYLIWIWQPVFRHCVGGGSLATFRFADVAHCGSLPPSPRSR
jgi:hypothetical protein